MYIKSLIFCLILAVSTAGFADDMNVTFYPDNKHGKLPTLGYQLSNFSSNPLGMDHITITQTATGFTFFNDGGPQCDPTNLTFTITVIAPNNQGSTNTTATMYVPAPPPPQCQPIGGGINTGQIDPSYYPAWEDSSPDQCIHINNQTYTLIYTILDNNYNHLQVMLYPLPFGSCK